MAAAGSSGVQIDVQAHHEQRKICGSRAKYREGRSPRAVKVYTVNLESRYLLVQGVPAIGVMKELVEHFALYGAIEEYNALDEYPAEQFAEVYLIKFQRLQSARVAKRKLDERSFFGGLLHICYAPEFESVQETREKLQNRRKYMAKATSGRDLQVTEKKKGAPKNSSHPGVPETGWTHSRVFGCAAPLHRSDPLELSFAPTPYIAPVKPMHDSYSVLGQTSREVYQDFVDQTHSSNNVSLQNPKTTIVSTHCTQSNQVGSSVRFMPRTTQLQARQRKREQNIALDLCGSTSDSQDIVIGPMLPETPKVDLDDDSLNITANFVRGKLKEVSRG
ncbi:RNA-binding protein 48 isoform 2-T2 [Discoglossus pictus]